VADINAIVSLGIGSPADVPHFILVGLSINDAVVADPDVTVDVFCVVRETPTTVIVRETPVSGIVRESPGTVVVG
jgi:hypothetical protein